MYKWIVTFLCIILLFPAIQHERARWDVAYAECTRQFKDNIEILGSDLCSFKGNEQARDMCSKARQENHLNPFQCAWRMFWVQSEFVYLYKSVTESTVMMLGLLVPSICLIIYLFMNGRSDKKYGNENQIFELFQYLLTQKQNTQYAPPPQIAYAHDENIQLVTPASVIKRRKYRNPHPQTYYY